ncbi:hypothetical protein LTR84_010177 [Exophiala bonariae]|uniref:Uncharacterized protein n=1 Tax=Exophiala bonariae TaxID=1690606 RepID=A0AAV9MUE1_9EURO|nr:hypothetical protein LTR84_010177 [Exophiala bonariae]
MRRTDRRLRSNDEKLPLVPAGTSNFGTFLQLDNSATADLAQTIFGTMGELAGIVPEALTHAIRRGGAKDGLEIAELYAGHEDEPVNLHKSKLPDLPVSSRTRGAQFPESPHHKLTAVELNERIDEYIMAHTEEVPLVRSVDFFIGPGPTTATDLQQYQNFGARIGCIVFELHKAESIEVQDGTLSTEPTNDQFLPHVDETTLPEEETLSLQHADTLIDDHLQLDTDDSDDDALDLGLSASQDERQLRAEHQKKVAEWEEGRPWQVLFEEVEKIINRGSAGQSKDVFTTDEIDDFVTDVFEPSVTSSIDTEHEACFNLAPWSFLPSSQATRSQTTEAS